MKPQSFTLCLALATSGSASIFPRTVQDILNDISTIGTNNQALEDALNKFTGNVNDAVPITTAQTTLENSVKKGTSDAQGTSTLSDSDATSVFNAITSLVPKVIESINVFVSKQSLFDTAGLGTIASSDISSLQKDNNDFAGALVSIAPSASRAAASSLSSCIDAAFSSALVSSTAKSCGGAATTTGVSEASSTSGSSGSQTSASGSSGSPTSASGGSNPATTTSSGASQAASTGAASSTHGSMGGLFGAVFAAACVFAL